MLEVEIGDEVVAYRGDGEDRVLAEVINVTPKYIDTRSRVGDRYPRDARWRRLDGAKVKSYHVKAQNKERVTDEAHVVAEVRAIRREAKERQGLLYDNKMKTGSIDVSCGKLSLEDTRVIGDMLDIVVRAVRAFEEEVAKETPVGSNGRYPHPRCPSCGGVMNKTMTKGKAVKTTDPWAFCRNAECKLHGKDQALKEKLKRLKKKSRT